MTAVPTGTNTLLAFAAAASTPAAQLHLRPLDDRPLAPQAPLTHSRRLLARLETLDALHLSDGLTTNERCAVQMLLVVQDYLLARRVPGNFLAMSPERIVQLVTNRHG